MYDTLLVGVAALLNLVLAYAGIYVAIRPVEQEKKRRLILVGCFAFSALALVVAVYLADRGTKAQTKLQGTVEHIDTGVKSVIGLMSTGQKSFSSVPYGQSASAATTHEPLSAKPRLETGFLQFEKYLYVTGDEFFTIGKPLQLNVLYINKGKVPVKSAHIAGTLALYPRTGSAQAAIDAAVLKNVGTPPQAQLDKGPTLGVDSLLYTTPSLPTALTQQMIDGIMTGQAILYVVSYARWTDSYGKPRDVLDCRWLNPPLDVHPGLDKLVWEECER